MKLKEALADFPPHRLSLIKRQAIRDGSILNRKFVIDDLMELPWRILKKEIPELFKEGDYEEAIHLITGIPLKKINKTKPSERLNFVLWINDQYEKITALEIQYLSSPPDADMIQAGIKELDILGDFVLIDNLAGGDVLKHSEVQQMPYSLVFNKQLKNTIENRVQKRLSEIQRQKVRR